MYSHYAGDKNYAINGNPDEWLKMHAEVGLLTRNIVIRGDDSRPAN